MMVIKLLFLMSIYVSLLSVQRICFFVSVSDHLVLSHCYCPCHIILYILSEHRLFLQKSKSFDAVRNIWLFSKVHAIVHHGCCFFLLLSMPGFLCLYYSVKDSNSYSFCLWVVLRAYFCLHLAAALCVLVDYRGLCVVCFWCNCISFWTKRPLFLFILSWYEDVNL